MRDQSIEITPGVIGLLRQRGTMKDLGINLHETNAYTLYSDSSRNKLEELWSQDFDSFLRIRNLLEDTQVSAAQLNECLEFFPAAPDCKNGKFLLVSIDSMHFCEQLPQHDDFSLAPDDVRERCTAFFVVMNAILQWGTMSDELKLLPSEHGSANYGPSQLTDGRVVELILNSQNRAYDIASMVKERGAYDFETIHSFLTSDVPALWEGAL